MKDTFLPIGSIVLLTNTLKKVMIIGYLVVSNNNSKIIYDYAGCMYPEGVISSEQVIVFNRNQIKEVIHTGLESLEEKNLVDKLMNYTN